MSRGEGQRGEREGEGQADSVPSAMRGWISRP